MPLASTSTRPIQTLFWVSTAGRARMMVMSSVPAKAPLLRYQRSALGVVPIVTDSTEPETESVMPVTPLPIAAWVRVKPFSVGLATMPPSITSHRPESSAVPPKPSENRTAWLE